MPRASTASAIALVLWPAVQYRTGQAFDLARIARAAAPARLRCRIRPRARDRQPAAGPARLRRRLRRLVQLQVPERRPGGDRRLLRARAAHAGTRAHAPPRTLPGAARRLVGPRGADALSHGAAVRAAAGVAAWQLSNPPILAAAPLLASLNIFTEAGIGALREKSCALTGFLEAALARARPARSGHHARRSRAARLPALAAHRHRCGARAGGCSRPSTCAASICDWRAPDIIRVAPVPLYNRFEDAWQFAQLLGEVLRP